MKRVLLIVLSVVLCFSLMPLGSLVVFSEGNTGTEIGDLLGEGVQEGRTASGLVYAYKSDQAVIVGYEGESTNLVIPAEIDGYTVIAIGTAAFQNNNVIENVRIDASITYIPGGTFSGCNALTSVELPDTIQKIENVAFMSCYNLAEINIPAALERIDDQAFGNCTSLRIDLVLEDVVLGMEAFSYSNIRTITLTNVDMGGFAFQNNPEVTAVSVTGGNISYGAFGGCTALETVELQDVGTIGEGAFQGDLSLKQVILPTGTTSIGNMAFANCTCLSGIYIPATVVSIADSAFKNDPLLAIYGQDETTAQSFAGAQEIEFVIGAMGQINAGYGTADGFRYAYKSNKAVIIGYEGESTNLVIPAEIDGYTVIAIGTAAFQNNNVIENVRIDASITYIPGGTFSGCNALTSVELPDTIQKIENVAFMSCYNLAEINIPAALERIDDQAFGNCTSLRIDLVLEDVVLGMEAFSYSNIRTITLTNVDMGGFAFQNNPEVTAVSVTGGNISYGAFGGCTALETVELQDVGTIGEGAFQGDLSLKQVILPTGTTSIGNMAFANCTRLSGIYIPLTVVSIGDTAFDNDPFLFVSTDHVGDGESMIKTYCDEHDIPCVVINYESETQKENGEWIGDIESEALDNYDGTRGLYITSKDGQVWFNPNAVANITREKNDNGVHLGWGVVGSNPHTGNAQFDDTIEDVLNNGGKVFNFNLSTNRFDLDERTGKINFGGENGGGADLTVPIDTGLKHVTVYYVDENGHKVKVQSNYNKKTGVVTFHTSHFSYYTLEEDDLVELDESDVTVNHSASLTENFAYNYYYTLGENGSLFGSYDDVWLELAVRDYTAADSYEFIDEQGVCYNLKNKVINSWTEDTQKGYSRYRFAFNGIAAAEIGNLITAKLHATKNGIEYCTPDDNSSIRLYAYSRIEKTQDTDLKSLLVDMLNYCSEAQTYFGYHTSDLVNAGLTSEQLVLGTQEDVVLTQTQEIIELSGEATGFISSKSITLGNTIELKYYMTFDPSVDVNNVELRLDYQPLVGDHVYVQISGSDFGYDAQNDRYYAKLSTIAAADTGSMISATIYQNEEAISDTLVYGVEVYCKNRLENSSNAALKQLLRIMLKYTRNAESYFTN